MYGYCQVVGCKELAELTLVLPVGKGKLFSKLDLCRKDFDVLVEENT